MKWKGFQTFIGTGIILSLLVIIVFIVLQWLQVPAGSFVDWLIGIASFWWLLVVVTVPWNIHFQAREVLYHAALSQARTIAVNTGQLAYVRRWVSRSLLIAVVLHLISALAMYALAATGISPVGYVSAGAALLLTVLRPVVRAYEYVVARLTAIAQEVRYPRNEVLKLTEDLAQMQGRIKQLEAKLDLESAQSWVSQQNAALADLRARIDTTRATLDDLRATNQAEHLRLSREAQSAIAQISADGQFLNHVREIIRFVKEA